MINNLKTLKKQIIIVLSTLCLIPLISNSLIDKKSFTVMKDFNVTIHGTSNLHEWDEKVGIVSGNSSVKWNVDGSFDIETVSIKMDVRSIRSDKGSVMDNNTYKALKGEAHPQITFALNKTLKAMQFHSAKIIPAKGKLTIAGVTKPIDMQVKVFMHNKGKMSFEGSQVIKMTDYGISPPTAIFGTLKTGNIIVLKYKINFN